MDAEEAMLTRRSVRRYTDEPVSDEVVLRLLSAAMAAPSARDQRPWCFIVVRNRDRLKELAAAEPNGAMIARAQVAVVVCADLDLVKSEGFWIQDCAAATENLLLAAHAEGLGAVWVGTYPREERVTGVKAVFGLPEHLVPFSVVPMGHPAERPAPAYRFDPGRVYHDCYEEKA
jgi:nitroreductase